MWRKAYTSTTNLEVATRKFTGEKYCCFVYSRKCNTDFSEHGGTFTKRAGSMSGLVS
jgi:hypothetical protein